ncbi:Acetyltransferase (isoleucine patch superfamily) [Flaviramulus basaltis]|uniref:Acetyltransferase (Isoleucine patch superfamily) n=1 Tax=Flaviramulus basaltis TaxID=369401 RepID=A0A1K2IM03_9FLAO|nr:transferase [Flaviramulus basaltis]SFZ92699.1 Acetyltransferase (isoleucine patch superfamily) [Flaviramulus basaltis]
MIKFLKKKYRWIKFQLSVNWIKTLYFNFKMFPFQIAAKLPVYFYGSVKFTSLNGNIIIEAPIKRSMVGFGQQFELATRSKRTAEINLNGDLKIKGHVHIGKDYMIYIGVNAFCEFGHMVCLGSDVKLFCTNKIVLNNWARIGYQSQVLDTNFHNMFNIVTKERYPLSSPITIGSYNSIANRNTIMQNTKTPDYCVVASNSLLNKDYTLLGNNILLAGVPARLVRENFSRDWEGEKVSIEKFLIRKK